MSITLTVRDETMSGAISDERPLEFPSERITVRDLIRERIYQEVQDYNRDHDAPVFRGLVQPTDAERLNNGTPTEYRLETRREIDWKSQFDKAIEAFEHNAYFLLIDEAQAESLDQEITIGRGTLVSFIKLTPLVGG